MPLRKSFRGNNTGAKEDNDSHISSYNWEESYIMTKGKKHLSLFMSLVMALTILSLGSITALTNDETPKKNTIRHKLNIHAV